jgi:DNA-binding MarR family transcriptional regulator
MERKLTQHQIQIVETLGKQFSDATMQMHEAVAQKLGLTSTDHKYLKILLEKGAMTAGEFSKFTGLTTGAITGLVDRLEAKDLANRQFDKEDRRKVIIVPNTENAQKLLMPIFANLQERILTLITSFSDEEIRIVENYLISTIDIMKNITHDLNNF